MPILFRCSSNPDDRRPSGFKIHFIAAKLQPPAQNLQIKVKKVKSLEWMEGTLKIARHQKLQMRSNAMDTMLILSRYKGNLPVPIVQFHFNISQTAVDHPSPSRPPPPRSFWTSISLLNLGTLHKSTRQLNGIKQGTLKNSGTDGGVAKYVGGRLLWRQSKQAQATLKNCWWMSSQLS